MPEAIPLINLNFDEPSVKKLKDFIRLISTQFSDEPNYQLAIMVLETLVFIKLNKDWFAYAESNKTDKNIYQYKTRSGSRLSDIDKQVIRAHNDMAIHFWVFKM